MTKVDLITGFLGAGKTTFIHKYLQYLKTQGQKIRLIENEFGDVNVDSHLLEEETCEIEDLTGLCMCCVGKDAFIRLLKDSAGGGFDRIIVEPSGIYDVDEFFEVLSLPEIHSTCEIGTIITIADPYGMKYLSEEARYLLFAQLLASGMVLISKSQWLSEEEKKDVCYQLDELMKEKGCAYGLSAELCLKPWDIWEEDDWEDLISSGYARFVHDRELFSHSDTFQSYALIGHCKDKADLTKRIERVFESPSCGRIYRIKGYVKEQDSYFEVNCTAETYSIRQVEAAEEALVVIGQQIREREIKEILSAKR